MRADVLGEAIAGTEGTTSGVGDGGAGVGAVGALLLDLDVLPFFGFTGFDVDEEGIGDEGVGAVVVDWLLPFFDLCFLGGLPLPPRRGRCED